jgi:choline kinase
VLWGGCVGTIGHQNIVLLAAGKGTRLAELTEATHKSMLPIAGKPAIERILDAILKHDPAQIVVVLGHRADELEAFIRQRFQANITFVVNSRYAEDTNVLSADVGVDGLDAPEKGYLIVETDLILADAAWEMILSQSSEHAFWVTKDQYSPTLTGGALNATEDGKVLDLVYAPKFDVQYAGWKKLVGLLYVGPAQVEADRGIRKRAIATSIKQYYMTPWVDNLPLLDCRVLDLGSQFAASYNDLDAYTRADASSVELL